MADENTRSSDLVVKPNQYVYVLDETKGQISIMVGPQKTSMAGTEKTVRYNPKTFAFDVCTPMQAIMQFTAVPTGHYVVLENPAKGALAHPEIGKLQTYVDLLHGFKVNLAGPSFFPLWPGQAATVVEAHNLRSNQYLIGRVYDEDAAKSNIHEAVLKPQVSEGETEGDVAVTARTSLLTTQEIVTGKLFIINGTDVSFYIPPTGIEILPDSEGKYVRDAVTLEQLEYCVLLDENGAKRFERGPQVVFPKPTERFLKRTVAGRATRRFRAIELNNLSGIYIKVISTYTDNGRTYAEGEELFITGVEQRIYFPRMEHSIIRYGDRDIHYAVAVPAGEARYVLNRDTGDIQLTEGPMMFLADPRKVMIVRRVLPVDKVKLWFPNNSTAIEYNKNLLSAAGAADGFITDKQYRSSRPIASADLASFTTDSMTRGVASYSSSFSEFEQPDEVAEEHAGDSMRRKTEFTPPMTITLDGGKYDGAIKIRLWTGYAVQIVNGAGVRRVVVGPDVVHLQYDEELERFFFSKGKPKSTASVHEDVYLRVTNNKVTDIIELETNDLVKLSVMVSFRVNFEGEPTLWFAVENYVQHLCDHARSLLRNVAKKYGIQEFYAGYIDIIRSSILGDQQTDETTGLTTRPGRLFVENGMHVTEVEILECKIKDDTVRGMMENAQREIVKGMITTTHRRKQVELEQEDGLLKLASAIAATSLEIGLKTEDIKRIEGRELAAVRVNQADQAEQDRQNDLEVLVAENKAERKATRKRAKMALIAAEVAADNDLQPTLDLIAAAELQREQSQFTFQIDSMASITEDSIRRLVAEANSQVAISGSVQPGLVEALKALAQAGVLESTIKELAPLSIVKGLSLGATISGLFEGTAFEETIGKLVGNTGRLADKLDVPKRLEKTPTD